MYVKQENSKFTNELLAKVLEMRSNNITWREIGKRLNMNESSIRTALKRYERQAETVIISDILLLAFSSKWG